MNDVKVHFPRKDGVFRRTIGHAKAVDGVTLGIDEGETYGLAGESGSGKSTLARSMIGLTEITSGAIFFAGKHITLKNRKKMKDYQRHVQMIFQDPYSSLNPKKRVLDIVAEPLRNYEKNSRLEEKKKVQYWLEKAGLRPEAMNKYPHEFSGGQRQRIGTARALALKPKLIIADEAVSALDVSVQAQILNMMKDLQKEYQLTYLFISHDLGVLRHMCDRIGIMYKGRLVEEGTSKDIYENPQHIYTKRLIASIPEIDPDHREKQKALRKQMQKEYEHAYDQYFDKAGSVVDLKPISNTHSAAIP